MLQNYFEVHFRLSYSFNVEKLSSLIGCQTRKKNQKETEHDVDLNLISVTQKRLCKSVPQNYLQKRKLSNPIVILLDFSLFLNISADWFGTVISENGLNSE